MEIKPGNFRFILALIVVFYHITGFIYLGHFSVYCFFILSGYWISYMYSLKYQYAKNVGVYYISRYWRLMPVYLLFAAAMFILYLFINPTFLSTNRTNSGLFERVLFWCSQVLLVGNNQMDVDYILLTPSWSLDIELQFYLLFPALFFLLKQKQVSLYIGIIIFLIGGTLFIFYHANFFQRTVLGYLPFFYCGMMLYFNPIIIKNHVSFAFNFLFLMGLVIPYSLPLFGYSFNKSSILNEYYNFILPFFLLPFISKNVRSKSEGIDRTLGNLSYVVYFCHWFWYVPYKVVAANNYGIHKIIYATLYLVIVLVSSYFISVVYDNWFETKRKRWLEKIIVKG